MNSPIHSPSSDPFTTNPYAAPVSSVSDLPLPSSLHGITDFAQLKKLYHRSCNVNGIAFLLGLGLVITAGVLAVQQHTDEVKLILLALIAFYVPTIIGLYLRTSWGRILGIIACLLALINIPMGTIIGIMGLFAFFGAPQLFGPDRITHRAVKAQFKAQKAARR